MKKPILIILIFTLIFSCAKNPETYIDYIDGYWEIESVTLPDGSKREFTINETIDFISVGDSLKGFRKKLKPKFDGTFETSKSTEAFHIKIENDSLNLYYITKFSSWKETVLKATENQLEVINNNNKIYLYKKYQPITIE